jgi:hypothetical protein
MSNLQSLLFPSSLAFATSNTPPKGSQKSYYFTAETSLLLQIIIT